MNCCRIFIERVGIERVLCLQLGLSLQQGQGGPVLGQMISKVLGPNNPLGNVLEDTHKQGTVPLLYSALG